MNSRNMLSSFICGIMMLTWGGDIFAQEVCKDFDEEAPKFIQFFEKKIGALVHPENNEDLEKRITDIDVARINDFSKLAKNLAFTRYSDSSCSVNQMCNLSSVKFLLNTLVADIDRLSNCVKRNCAPSEATAVMLILQSMYEDIVKELRMCMSDK